mgnify:CR=1 FL=1|jgi:Large extracellular alpha-helical protein
MTFKQLFSLTCATLFVLFTTAQQKMNNYSTEWKNIDSLINKRGLTQSALKGVQNIYALAKKEGNEAQMIKALVYQVELLQATLDDEGRQKITQYEQEAAAAKEPARSILKSLAARAYWNWFQQNRWRLYDRTQTVNFNKEDLATWTAEDLHKKISVLYLASLSNEKLLQQTKLEPYDAVIIKGNVRHLRPTLFDLLAQEALNYFKNDERTIHQPTYAFEIDDATAFADAKIFATHRFTTRDTASLHFKALLIYQQLLQLHLNDAQPDALVDIDIDRIQFVYHNGVVEEKETLYTTALQRIADQYGNLPAGSQAWYLLAVWHVEKARQYDPLKGDSNRYEYVKAKDICTKVMAQRDSSEGKINCHNLLQDILDKEMNLQTEKINLPDQPFRTLVSYRNFNQLYFRVVKVDNKLREELGNYSWQDEFWNKLLTLPVVTSFSQPLPDTKDHQKHAVEIKIDALPIGQYALIASVDKDFKPGKEPLALQYFYVSNIAYIKKEHEYFVVHRQTGQPLANAAVQVWYRSYDYNVRKYTVSKGQRVVADKNGYAKLDIDTKSAEKNYKLEFTSGNDRLYLDDYNYTYYYGQPAVWKDQKITFLFTDRSIYRPGQTVYFKGIVINRKGDSKETSVLPNFRTSVWLMDANGQKVDTLSVTTNEFGAYSGKFTLPTGLLNGRFQLTDQRTKHSASISVEEYKRPKFLVELNKPAGAYRLNDTIQVSGTAKAYAGNSVDGATVKYRVVRKTIMPLWYYRMIWPPRVRESVEIAHGETTTNEKGEFIIRFKALPDREMAKKDQPVFHYEISTDVTDKAGETRSGSTQVSVAYQALKLHLSLPEKLHTDSLRRITLRSTNLNDVFEPTNVTVSVYKLKMPDRLYRTRYWPQPDTFVLSQEEYQKLFPYDAYKNENDPTQWARASKVAEKTGPTSDSLPFVINYGKLDAGWYVVEAITKDKYGEAVKELRYVLLYNKSVVSPLAMGGIVSNHANLEPGQKASYQVSTTVNDAFIIHEINRKNGQFERSFFKLDKSSKSFELPITENERGGLEVQIAFVKNNRIYTSRELFSVPYTNKELHITYETFRDKTLPGSEEKWKVKVSGYKGEKVAAEMLAAMYDASLDQFQPHAWQKPSLWENISVKAGWEGTDNFSAVQSLERYFRREEYVPFMKMYDRLGVALLPGGYGDRRELSRALAGRAAGIGVDAAAPAPVAMAMKENKSAPNGNMEKAEESAPGDMYAFGETVPEVPETTAPDAVPIRKNFHETAFFFPDLKTDANGAIEFSFTMPEAVTQWKWMSLAHTKELAFGYSEKTIVTQKDLMVQPNAPRFLREGDRMDFSGKIVNMTDKEITGQVQLELIDPSTNQPVDGWFRNMMPNQYFTVAPQQSTPVSFTIEIPFKYNKPVTYRIVARAGNVSDGEEAVLPVVSNRMLVTESLPLPVRGNAPKTFVFDKLTKSSSNETLHHQSLTVEFTTNPAWYAVQALPYLMEYPYDCAEQVFNRYYANALASTIANASPKIKEIFERWKNEDTSALISNLQKNEELKSVLLQETPWVLQAQNETQQKKNIALLFDMVRMSKELASAISKLQALQGPNGGFTWFKGGPDDRYITQYILTGIGHLKKLNALPDDNAIAHIVKQAIPYLDKRIKEDYEEMLKLNKQKVPATENIGGLQIQYLYMRSFFPEYAVPGDVFKAYHYYRSQSQKYWLKQGRYFQGMIALSLHRTGDVQTAKNILASLKQNAIVNEEMGMYWKDMPRGYYWYQAPVESQALLIEAFKEVANDTKAVDDMKTWLLKQKQTRNWYTTKATADAVYALLLQGTNWLTHEPQVAIQLGDASIRSSDQTQEAGTGYFKKVIEGSQVKPAMGNIKVSVEAPGQGAAPAWGAVYWQYFEDLDKITGAETPLKLSKKLFVEKNTDSGPVLQPLNAGDVLKVGDKVKVRIELRADRTMEYVHMKDMRAACMEPVNVISQYKWQGGLGYYESTKDASTNFFFSYLPKGTYVFEYPVFVTHTGTFSNGITSIQCMYAPEFASHSEGVKVTVE